ncbi:glycine/sarcosine/betaine reductase complex component C subunit beta [Thermosyntropha sp.]|uniref:glycine/sarcosine/betaine reductase complex component C subunit beta n=1 Tax=Thermosyntropha sp. TaxID=2740820 RepID=UPI0025E44008|nr:glycine/sarcosine/betaine reductase complex component C subunit beta [Thermosyntropha sp.]MBO8159522.1 glycine reductase [Thermosyntropha sp.]
MTYPVIKAAAYVLVHAPNILLEHGTTITTERLLNPDSEYLKVLPKYLRSFDDAVNYAPNQVYIGNMKPEELRGYPTPWYANPVSGSRDGKYGEIMPEDEFYGLLRIVDRFELVELSPEFASQIKPKIEARNLFSAKQLAALDKTLDLSEIEKMVANNEADGLYLDGKLVGCVRAAHETDENLSAHVVFENLVSKASGALVLANLIKKHGINPLDIDYIIETSEEAIGDMNQRGGGNLAKAIGEVCDCLNATGSDVRGFCAGPAHGIIHACAMVKAGVFKNVVVLAGGSSAKLGMNSRDHVKKDMPALEDMVGGYAILISENDGVSPVVRTDIVGKHKIASGSSPQAVIQAIVADPLEENGLKITDIDVFAPELQNPELTVPAGAGDVPMANYKMIGAMAVKKGEIDKKDLMMFAEKHGVPGFAPTQGHIPSGVPLVGHVVDEIKEGKMQRAMIIGKGSLFLGRMTDLFDGISFIIEKNSGKTEEIKEDSEALKQEIRELIAGAIKEVADSLAGR